MEKEDGIKIILYGVGAMGSEIAREINKNPAMKIVGAIDINKNIKGKDLGYVVNIGQNIGINITDDPEEVFKRNEADITIITAESLVQDVYPMIKRAIQAGNNVITIAEEMHFPWIKYPDISKKINLEAKKENVTVVQTGAIPGFWVDRVPVFLSQCCYRINKFNIKRISDWSPFGKLCMDHLGIGKPFEECQELLRKGKITVHIGMEESICFIANALGWDLDSVEVIKNLKATDIARETLVYKIKIEPGSVYGFNMIGKGIKDNKVLIEVDYTGFVCPTIEEKKQLVQSEVFIEGDPCLHMYINGDDYNARNEVGTVAPVINLINIIQDVRPGLLTINELPLHPPKLTF